MAFEQFHYTIPGDKRGTGRDKKISLPRFEHIPFGVMRKITAATQEEQIFTLFNELASMGKISASDMAAIDELQVADIGALVEAWQKDATTSLPES